ncbi:MAG TPA: nuclear transport factor 2 family protein [Pilimelia sp.]|nr:nuclear transport factor 2 family protein [Pilimelia sp.]
MAEHPHVALVRGGYEALSRGDIEAMSEFAVEDVAFHVPGRHQFAGDYRGLSAAREYYQRLDNATHGPYRIELEHIFADDRGHVVAVHRTTAERHGQTLDQRRATLFTIEDGRVVAIHVLDEDVAATDAFWA